MAVVSAIWAFFKTYFFTKAPMLMMLIILIGQLVVGEKFYKALGNAIKGYIGYSVFAVGTSGFSSSFGKILVAMQESFNFSLTYSEQTQGISMLQPILEEAGHALSIGGAVMVGHFLVAILLALPGVRKFTKIRAITIQGQILNNFSWTFIAAIFLMWTTPLTDIQIIILASILGGVYFAVHTNVAVEATQNLTGGAGMTVGHSQMWTNMIAYKIGERVAFNAKKKGKEVKTLNSIKLPGWLDIFNDAYIGAFVIMLLFFGTMMVAMGKEAIMAVDSSLTEKTPFAYYIFTTVAKFPIYLCIFQAGLRMFVSEMLVAFTGIQEKLLKGTLPGIDVAAFFGFASHPNAMTLGFVVGALTMILCTTIGVLLGSPFAILVGFVPMFYDNAAAGIFGHHKGGLKGLVLGSMVCGAVNVFGCGLGGYLLGFISRVGCISGASTDFAFAMPLWGALFRFGIVGYIAALLIMLAVPQIMYYRNKDTYWLVAFDYDKYREIKDAKEAAALAASAK